MRLLWSCLLVLWAFSCSARDVVQCRVDANCDRSSEGACLQHQSAMFFCAYRDPTCPGFRWSDLDVADEIRGKCVADAEPPSASLIAPTAAEDVAPAQVLAVRFSERVPEGAISPSSIFLENAALETIPVEMRLTAQDLTITPHRPLDPRTDHRLVLNEGVTDFAGHSLSPTRWLFRTRSAAWGATQRVFSDDTRASDEFSFGSFGGATVAVWAARVVSDSLWATEVWAAFHQDGIWLPAKMLSGAPDLMTNHVSVASTSEEIIAVWQQSESGASKVLWTSARKDASWKAPQPLALGAEDPKVATLASGELIALWWQGPELKSSTYTSQRGWSPAVLVASTASLGSVSSLVSSPSGAYALWNSSNELNVSELTSAGWQPPQPIASGSVSRASLVVSPNGPIVLWQANGWFVRQRENGAWGVPRRVDSETSPATYAAIAQTSSHTIVVWSENQLMNYITKHHGRPWGQMIRHPSSMSGIIYLEAASSAGRAMFSWMTSAGTYASEFNASYGWSPAEIANSTQSASRLFHDSELNLYLLSWSNQGIGLSTREFK